MDKEKLNCWEFMKCGRGPEDRYGKNMEPCPAAHDKRLEYVHGGRRAGRACWVVEGTFCGGSFQDSFAQKSISCKRCDFYQKVHAQEGDEIESNLSLLNRLKDLSTRVDITTKKLGVLLGGSGMIGGALTHYFKYNSPENVEVLSPTSKKLSLREPKDVEQYFEKYQPDFIINCAIAPLDSDAEMAYETNYLGSIRLAKMALALKIPFIHLSSTATMRMEKNISEEATESLHPKMPNYTKSKLMTEITLAHMHETQGLDYTVIRLGVVYGKHDHKIQGFQRLLFSIADQSMPYIMSRPGIFHSYTHSKKVPPFMNHILENREEFTGQTYNFVDKEPVELVALIKTIKEQLGARLPRNIYVPYSLAKTGRSLVQWFVRRLGGIGVEIRLPAELMFMRKFYKSQTLLTEKVEQSSYEDPAPDVTIYTELPAMLDYYLTRWHHFNQLSSDRTEIYDPHKPIDRFKESPQDLLDSVHQNIFLPYDEFDERF